MTLKHKKSAYTLSDADVTLSLLNLFGLLYTVGHIAAMFLGALKSPFGYLYIISNFITSVTLCIICFALYWCNINRRIIYRFSVQLFAVVIAIFLTGYVSSYTKEFQCVFLMICTSIVILLQGVYYRIKDYYAARNSIIPSIPVSFNVVAVASKVWPLALTSIITFSLTSITVSFIVGKEILQQGLIVFTYIFFFYAPLWLLSVITYIFGFNRSFFDNRLFQIIWSFLYAVSLLYVRSYTDITEDGHDPSNQFFLCLSYIPPTLFYLAQGIYSNRKQTQS